MSLVSDQTGDQSSGDLSQQGKAEGGWVWSHTSRCQVPGSATGFTGLEANHGKHLPIGLLMWIMPAPITGQMRPKIPYMKLIYKLRNTIYFLCFNKTNSTAVSARHCLKNMNSFNPRNNPEVGRIILILKMMVLRHGDL